MPIALVIRTIPKFLREFSTLSLSLSLIFSPSVVVVSRLYLENSRWKVNFVPWKKLYRSNYWGVRSQEWWCSKKKKEGKRNGKRRKGREGFNRHCCTSMPENFHHRPLILSLSSLTNSSASVFFSFLLFSSFFFWISEDHHTCFTIL